MGRPLYSTQTQISAITSKKFVEESLKLLDAGEDLLTGENKWLYYYPATKEIGKIRAIHCYSDLFNAASGNVSLNLYSGSLNSNSVTFNFDKRINFMNGVPKYYAEMFPSLSTDFIMMYKTIMFSENQNFKLYLLNNTDVTISGELAVRISYLSEKVE